MLVENKLKDLKDEDFSSIPRGLITSLFDFQWKGLEFAIQHEGELIFQLPFLIF